MLWPPRWSPSGSASEHRRVIVALNAIVEERRLARLRGALPAAGPRTENAIDKREPRATLECPGAVATPAVPPQLRVLVSKVTTLRLFGRRGALGLTQVLAGA
jgi:hypothetical protein